MKWNKNNKLLNIIWNYGKKWRLKLIIIRSNWEISNETINHLRLETCKIFDQKRKKTFKQGVKENDFSNRTYITVVTQIKCVRFSVIKDILNILHLLSNFFKYPHLSLTGLFFSTINTSNKKRRRKNTWLLMLMCFW